MKIADYRKMTDEELHKEIDALRKSQFQVRTKQVTDVVENSASIKNTRRDLARVQTILSERRIKAAAVKKPPAPAAAKTAPAPEKKPQKPGKS